MEGRYLVSSVVITTLSTIFIVYGAAVASYQIIGVALSSMVVGVVLLTIGVTHSRPIEELLKLYSDDLNMFATRVLEDVGIVGSHKIKLCIEKKAVVFSEKLVECSSVAPGVGIINGVPYVALPISSTIKVVSKLVEGSSELAEVIRKLAIDAGGVCRTLSIYIEDGVVAVEMSELTKYAEEIMKHPVNIVRLAILASTAIHLNSNAEIVEEAATADSYRLKIRVLGS